jgi:hypothetical protein
MPIVTVRPAPSDDPALARGRLVVITGVRTNAATDSSGSKYFLASVPSDAYLDNLTEFHVANDGYAAIRIGTVAVVDALVSQTKATENIIRPVVTGNAKWNKPLWELLGFSADPGGVIGLWKHAIADATGAGTFNFRIAYLTR